MKRILGLGLFSILFALPARAENINGTEISKTAAAIAFTQDIDLASYKGAAVQAVYSDGTPAAHNVSDGAKESATLTILSSTSLLGNTISVGTNTVTFGSVGLSTGPATGNSTVIIATTVAAALRAAHGGDEAVIRFSTGVVSGNSVVTATTTLVDATVRYVSASSTNTSWGTPFFTGGTSPDIDVTNDIITHTAHGLTTGLRVWVSTTAGTIPTGLTMGTSYYAIALTADTYALATSSTNAVAGTKVDITANIGSSTIGTHPLALVLSAGAASNTGFKWQASNDGTNFYDVSLASVTYSTASNYLWDLGAVNYRWLRMNFTPPTSGGIAVSAVLNGKR